jgi:hypothetical protein
MTITIRAAVSLLPGCKLSYEPPLSGDSFSSDLFFKKNRGRFVTFVAYAETLVGLLDFWGRAPGRYVNKDCIQVRFDGEDEVQLLNSRHFVLTDSVRAELHGEILSNERVGDLPMQIDFYPGDFVRFVCPHHTALPNAAYEVKDVWLKDGHFNLGNEARYYVVDTEASTLARAKVRREKNNALPEDQRMHILPTIFPDGWNTPRSDIELVSRGNVYWLYHDPSRLIFSSDEEEVRFWIRSGISAMNAAGVTLKDVCKLFEQELADVIEIPRHLLQSSTIEFASYKLHKLFEVHRPRVRALTQRIWSEEFKGVIA